MLLEHLETDRLAFRCLVPQDKELLLEFFNDPVATEFHFLETDNIDSHTSSWLTRQMRRYQSYGCSLYAIILKDSGELVGTCGLVRQFVDSVPKIEIGYHFIRRYWGKGYATEAAIACRDFAFENELAETVISLIHPENYRSQGVARRNGMTPWKETIFKGHPAIVFRIRRVDWEVLCQTSVVNIQ